MRIFVAGAGGFVGGRTAALLQSEGHEVIPHVRRRDGDFVPGAVPRGAEAVVNAAGRLGGRDVTPDDLLQANRDLPQMLGLLCADRGIPLVHLSTPGVTGLVAGAVEDSPSAPWGGYEKAKAEAEEILAGIKGLVVTILRPDFVYGPGDRHKLALFRQIASGFMPLVGGGKARLRPTFVTDAASAVAESLPGGRLGAGTWNIGGPEVVSFRTLCRTISKALGRRTLMPRVPARLLRMLLALGPLAPGAVSRSRLELFGRDHFVDTSRAASAGFAPRTGLEEGIGMTVAWYRREGLL